MWNGAKRQQIGLLGGTFDPLHNGHLAVAHHVLHKLRLDAIWFIPASLPPHKVGHGDGREISGFAHRLAMLQGAVSQHPSFIISGIEAKRTEPSYSIDTINILMQRLGGQADMYFIIGADAFIEIDSWKGYKELPTLVSFVIIARKSYPPDQVGEVIRHSFRNYEFNSLLQRWESLQSRGSFIILPMEPVPISSTEIRTKVRTGEVITGLVPPSVEEYIRKHHLYNS